VEEGRGAAGGGDGEEEAGAWRGSIPTRSPALATRVDVRQQGRLKDAEELEMLVMGIRKRLLGEEHPDSLISMGNLALTYSDRAVGRRPRS